MLNSRFLLKLKQVLFFSFFLVLTFSASAQNFLINPSTDGGFEGAHGWTIVNHPTGENKWFIGGAVKNSGAAGAYVSNNPTTQTLTPAQAGNNLIYLYKDVVVPANASSISLSFSFKNPVNTTNPPRVFFAKTSEFIAPSTTGTYTNVTTLTRVLANEQNWINYTNTSPLVQDRQVTYTSRNLQPGESYRILFEWSAINQTSYTQTYPLPPTRYPTNARIVASAANYIPGGTITNTIQWDQDGVNYGIEWSVDAPARIQSGQGTRSIVVFYPLGTTGLKYVRAKWTAPTPTFQYNGVNSGSLAIDNVSLSYVGVPSITALSASRGEVGSNVTLTGEFFDPTAANNVVFLGGVKCTVVSGTATSLTVTVPTHAHAGTFTVTNTVTKLTATSNQRFLPVHPILLATDYAGHQFINNAFEEPVAFATSFSSSFDKKFALVDVEGDGKLDVVSYASSGVPQLLRNTSTSGRVDAATFAAVRSITGVSPTYSPNSSRSILFGDFNGDGKIDFGTSNNVNNGGFVNPNTSANNTAALGSSSSLLTSAGNYKVNGAFLPIDINRDGKLDIFGVTSDQGAPRPFYSRNNSTGNTPSFVTRESTTGFDLTSAYGGDVADFDGNGTIDAVYGADGFAVLYDNSTRRGTQFESNFTLIRSALIPIPNFTGIPYTVKFFDLDGDGRLDILATNSLINAVHVWRNTGGSDLVDFKKDFQLIGLRNTVGLSIADMNGDGKPDLVVGDYLQNTGSKIAYLENQSTSGTISFKESVVLIESASAYQQLEVVDIDGDRKPDILGANVTNSTLDVFRNRLGESGKISGETTVCSGTSSALISSDAAGTVLTGNIVYSWQKSTSSATSGFTTINGETGATLSPGALTQNTFFRRGIASSAVPGTVYYTLPVKLTVSALPTITNAPAVANCGPGQVVLKAETSAGDGSFVRWYDAATGGTLLGRVASGANFTSPSVTQSTTFYAEAETASGCISAARVAVPVTLNLALPVVTLGSFTSTKCDSDDFTLTASTSSEAVIRWYDVATGGTLLREGNSFTTPILSANTTYYVEAVNCNGPSARQAVTVTLIPGPTITAAPNVSICQNGSTTLTATASAGTLNWYTAATGGTANAANATVSNITSSVTRYVSATVTVNGVTCEGPRVPVTVTMNALPVISGTGATIYGESEATISVSNVSETSVSWYSDAAASQLLLAGNRVFTTPVIRANTTYYAVATNLTTGCQSTVVPVTVTYNGPTFSALANAFAMTNQQNMQIKASGLGNYLSYKWQRSDNGGATWVDVTASLDGITYSGVSGNSPATTATLTLSVADPKLHGYQYRVLLTGTSSSHSVPTGASILTVADIYGKGTAGTQDYTLSQQTTTTLSNGSFTSSLANLKDGNIQTGLVAQNTDSENAQRGLGFDGSNDKVSVPDNNAHDLPSTFTLEAWVKIDASVTNLAGTRYGVVTKVQWAGSGLGYGLDIEDGKPRVFSGQSYNDWSGAQSSSTLPINTWVHLAGTYNGSTFKVYVNGVEVASQTSYTGVSNNSQSLTIGSWPSENKFFKGEIDEVRVWNVARTVTQIADNDGVELVGNESGLVSYYKFNQGTPGASNASETTALDSGPSGLNGTLSGFALTGNSSNWVSVTGAAASNPKKFSTIVADLGSSVVINGIRLANLPTGIFGGATVTPNFTGGYIESSTDGSNWTRRFETIPSLPSDGATLALNEVTARYFRIRKEDQATGVYYGLSELAFLSSGYETVPYIRQALPSEEIYVFQGTALNLSTTATASAGQTISTQRWSSSTSPTGPFTDLNDGTVGGLGTVSGATTNSLNIANYSNSNPTYYRLTATQSNGATVSSQSQSRIFLETVQYYPTVAGTGALQTNASWTTASNGSGGSQPPNFNADKFFTLANGSSYALAGDWTNNGSLNFNGNSLTLTSQTATLAKWDGSSSTAFVKTQGAGYLSSAVTSAPKIFPVGNTRYSPVTLTRNSGSNEAFFVSASESVSNPAATNYLKKTWKIKKASAANSGAVNVDATFAWDAADLEGGSLSLPMVFQSTLATGPWTELVPNTDYASLELGSNQMTIRGLKGLLSTTDRFFIIKNAVPKVSSISPTTTGVGQPVVITGTNFTAASAVTLGGTAVTSFVVNSATQITATVGSGTTGNVVVTTPGGTGTLNAAFTFLQVPTITSFTPVREQVGNRVTITGTNFASVTGVTIGGVAVSSYQVISATSINAFVPVGASDGSVTVTTLGGTASKSGFSVGFSTPQNPELATLSNIEVRLSDRQMTFGTPFSKSNGAITISTPANNGVANYANNKITFQAIGTTTLTVAQASTLDYQAATRTPSITVKDYPILEFADLVGKVGDPARTLAATSVSQGAITYQSSNAAVGSISGSTLTIQGKGIAEITATQAASGFYLGAAAKAVLLVKDPSKSDPSISWISPLSKTLDDVSLTLAQATSNSTGAFTYFSSNPQVATISGRTVNLVGNGVTVLTAAQEESSAYNAGKAVTILIVGDPYKLPAQLTGLANVTKLVTDAAFTLTAPSTQSAATIQYVLGDDRIASISGNTVTLKTNGTTKIYALQKETATHQAGMTEATLLVNLPPVPAIDYSDAVNLRLGTSITPLNPTSTAGTVTEYSIWPPLPVGLTLNAQTGVIQGTPQSLAERRTYQVTGSNLGGPAQTSLDLSVIDLAPTNLTYVTPQVLIKDASSTPLLPTVGGGGAVVSYNITPALPVGLAFNTLTGEISGTPTVISSATNYTIKAINSGGEASFTLSLTVNDIAPASLSYPSPNLLAKNVAMSPLLPITTGGQITQYSVVGTALPAGLTLNAQTGAITGAPTGIFDLTTFTIRGQNVSGFLDATLQFASNDSPPVISYTSPTRVTKGQAMAALVPSSTGGAANSFTISPALPTGLSFDETTGVISGTPTVVSPSTLYSIRAYNFSGDNDFSLDLTVVDVPPSALSYSGGTTFTKGTASATSAPTVSGGPVIQYSISPSLPAGLVLDPNTGVISGTPTVILATTSFTVTATNSGGSTTFSLALTVNDAAPSALTYPSREAFIRGTAIQTMTPTANGGAVVSYSISPTLPAGLAFNASTGAISGTGTVVSPATNYVVTATNSGGSTTTTLSLQVRKSTLLVTVGDATKIFGAADPSFTLSYSGFILGEGPSQVTGQAVYTRTAGESAGSYSISASGLSSTLYDLSYQTGTLRITNTSITTGTTVSSIADQVYAGIAIEPSMEVRNGSTVLLLSRDYSLAFSNNTNVGTATVTITGLGNYGGTLTRNFTITKKPLTVQVVNQNKNSGLADPSFTVTYSGFVGNQTEAVLSGTIAFTRAAGETPGTYAITASGLTSTNYLLSYLPGTLTIVSFDTDGDGVPDHVEVQQGTDPNDATDYKDSDGDGVPDHVEVQQGTNPNNGSDATDSDGDGVPDYIEEREGTDPNDPTDFKDSDGDGVPDFVEVQQGTNPSNASDAKDSDGDGVPDFIELQQGTDPNNSDDAIDTDGDGVPDYIEEREGTDPNDPRDFKDSDGDGIPDYVEVQDGTDPNDSKEFKDSDGDGVPDFIEVQQGTDPSDPRDFKDTDGDGVPDFIEVQQGTNPTNATDAKDSDRDGVPDYIEILQGTNPADSNDVKDSDGDGVPDFVENQQGTDPANPRSFKDSDGGGVPDYVETVVYPRLGLSLSNPANSIDDLSDRDGDGVSDYQEYLDGTDPKDPGDYKDSDGDGVPDQVERQEGSNPNSATSFKDSDGDGVADYIQSRSFKEGIAADLVILWGDKDFASKLSSRVQMRTTKNELVSVQITWDDFSAVTPFARGAYLAKGTITVPKGYFNPYKVKGIQKVIVLPKAAPVDVTITNSSFVGSTTSYFISVGDFVVNDPVDKIHTVSLLGPGYDNKYFEIKSNILFWSSADLAAGKTRFSIIVRVTDRDGNTLDKFFEISRTRPSITSLEVANTFSPNGDRFNDTWGIEGARFYSGTTLQIFDRGGTRVFNTEDPSQRWDGTYLGKELPIGTYYWTLNVAETGEMRRGVLNVLKK